MIKNIGEVVTIFASDGRIKSVTFIPEKLLADLEVITEFNNRLVGQKQLPIQMRAIGETMLSKFFTNNTTIELADKTRFQIESEMVACEKYKDGITKKCVIRFFLADYGL